MFEHLAVHKKIVVTGPQRSGTRIGAKMIAADTGHEFVDEAEFLIKDSDLFRQFLESDGVVVQAPHMLKDVVDDPPPGIFIVLMRRDLDDIHASADRIGWTENFGGNTTELKKFGLTEGDSAAVKYEYWDTHDKLVPFLEVPVRVAAGPPHVRVPTSSARRSATGRPNCRLTPGGPGPAATASGPRRAAPECFRPECDRVSPGRQGHRGWGLTISPREPDHQLRYVGLVPRVLSIVLAGGEGKRLLPLTLDRAKPAVPFGGHYRLIDFALSNLANAGFTQVVVLTQYKSHSLDLHITRTWRFSTLLGSYVTPVPAQMRRGPWWFAGSADAIYQNLNIIRDERPEYILVFGADHIYRMDPRQMLLPAHRHRGGGHGGRHQGAAGAGRRLRHNRAGRGDDYRPFRRKAS